MAVRGLAGPAPDKRQGSTKPWTTWVRDTALRSAVHSDMSKVTAHVGVIDLHQVNVPSSAG